MLHPHFNTQLYQTSEFETPYSVEFYSLLMFRGKSNFSADDTPYSSEGFTLLFLTPYQRFQWLSGAEEDVRLMHFHGDFYCIEYHKKEVACNGLLFNNIYLKPFIEASVQIWDEVTFTLDKIAEYSLTEGDNYSEAVVRSYLQLILAISSRTKALEMEKSEQENVEITNEIAQFRRLIDENFINERSVSFYADHFGISSHAFSKKIKKELGKTPMQLIQERVTLEAKKLLHLTYKPVKEIASELNFEDEFYFSRYFKKNVGLSPPPLPRESRHFHRGKNVYVISTFVHYSVFLFTVILQCGNLLLITKYSTKNNEQII